MRSQASTEVNVFVFGTLKKGFPLHELGLAGAAAIGECRTVERFPLVIAGPWFAPMMFNEPSAGYHVHGELYRVDMVLLERLDRLESVGMPDHFRVPILVRTVSSGRAVGAFAFMKSRNLAKPMHSPLLECYIDDRFIPP